MELPDWKNPLDRDRFLFCCLEAEKQLRQENFESPTIDTQLFPEFSPAVFHAINQFRAENLPETSHLTVLSSTVDKYAPIIARLLLTVEQVYKCFSKTRLPYYPAAAEPIPEVWQTLIDSADKALGTLAPYLLEYFRWSYEKRQKAPTDPLNEIRLPRPDSHANDNNRGNSHPRSRPDNNRGNSHSRSRPDNNRGNSHPRSRPDNNRGNSHPRSRPDNNRGNSHPRSRPDNNRGNSHPRSGPGKFNIDRGSNEIKIRQATNLAKMKVEYLKLHSEVPTAELEPVNSFLRRLQHQVIVESGFESESKGEASDRYVVIKRPAEK